MVMLLESCFDPEVRRSAAVSIRLGPWMNAALAAGGSGSASWPQPLLSMNVPIILQPHPHLLSCKRYNKDGAPCGCIEEHTIQLRTLACSREARRNLVWWPHVACSRTGLSTESETWAACAASQQGAWTVPESEAASFPEACVQRCERCSRCQFVSASRKNQDCSWYATCESSSWVTDEGVGAGDSYVTRQVRGNASRGSGGDAAAPTSKLLPSTELRLLRPTLTARLRSDRGCMDAINFRSNGPQDARLLPLSRHTVLVLYSEYLTEHGPFRGLHRAHNQSRQRHIFARMLHLRISRSAIDDAHWAGPAVRLHGAKTASTTDVPSRPVVELADVEKNWAPFTLDFPIEPLQPETSNISRGMRRSKSSSTSIHGKRQQFTTGSSDASGNRIESEVYLHQWLMPTTVALRFDPSSGELLERYDSDASRARALLDVADHAVVSGGTPAVRLNATTFMAIGHVSTQPRALTTSKRGASHLTRRFRASDAHRAGALVRKACSALVEAIYGLRLHFQCGTAIRAHGRLAPLPDALATLRASL